MQEIERSILLSVIPRFGHGGKRLKSRRKKLELKCAHKIVVALSLYISVEKNLEKLEVKIEDNKQEKDSNTKEISEWHEATRQEAKWGGWELTDCNVRVLKGLYNSNISSPEKEEEKK